MANKPKIVITGAQGSVKRGLISWLRNEIEKKFSGDEFEILDFGFKEGREKIKSYENEKVLSIYLRDDVHDKPDGFNHVIEFSITDLRLDFIWEKVDEFLTKQKVA